MRRKLLFLMLFVSLLCLPVTAQAANLNKNPSFEIDEDPADNWPDGWWYWTWTGGGGSYGDFVNWVEDPCTARTGDWYFRGLGSGWGSSATPAAFGNSDPENLSVGDIDNMTPIKLAGQYYVGGYARDEKPGGEDSPYPPMCEVLYADADGVRVGNQTTGPYTTAGDPIRHFIGADDNPTGSPMDIPRDGEYHLYYGLTQPTSALLLTYAVGGPIKYLTAGCWLNSGCEYSFDDMYSGDSLPGAKVWPLDPADEEAGISPTQTTLSWGRQQVCGGDVGIPCEVWWGSDDPNFWDEDPIKIMEMTDTNSLDLLTIPAGLGGPIVLAPESHFYWAIIYEDVNDCYFGTRVKASDDGWHFDTINSPPVVDAGKHQDLWQNGNADPIVIAMDATVTDDGNPVGGTVTYTWTETLDNGAIAPTYDPSRTVEDPNVTFSATGDYALKLAVNDGDGHPQSQIGDNTILIRIIANSDNRLRAHYKLDEAAGDVASDSEESHDGTRNDDATWQPVGGQVDGAIELDGSSDFVGIDDTGSDPNQAESDTWENSDLIDGMTVSAWMKLDADGWSTSWEAIVAKSNLSWELGRNAGNAGARFVVQQGIGDATGTGNTDLESGWHQVVGVYDRNTVKIYVDGLEAGSSNAGTLDLDAESNLDYLGNPINDREWQIPKAPGKVRIGAASNTGGDLAFGGLIDQVRIFDAAVPWWAQHAGTPGIVEMYRADGGHVNCGGQYSTSDINEDCFTDLGDAALLALDWVECTNIIDVDCDLSHHEE